MTIQKIELGSIPNGFGGDNKRTGFDKVNKNFGDQENAASRTVGRQDAQLPSNNDVKKLTVNAKRTYKTLTKAIEAIPDLAVNTLIEVISDPTPDNNRMYEYDGKSFVPTSVTPVYATAQDFAGVSVAITDGANNRTWLEANDTDGGPTATSIKAIQDKLTFPEIPPPPVIPEMPFYYVDNNPLSYAFVDKDNNLTDIMLNEYGQFPDMVLQDWLTRMKSMSGWPSVSPPVPPSGGSATTLPKLDIKNLMPAMESTTTVINKSDTHYKNGELLPVMPDVNKVIYIGSSSAQKSANYLQSALKLINPSVTLYAPAYAGATIEAQEIWVGSNTLKLKVSNNLLKSTGGTLVIPSFNLSTSAYINNISGWIEGVLGTIKASGGAFYFTRTTNSATDLAVPNTVEFIPKAGNEYRNGIQILWLGKNNLTSTNNADNDVDMLMDKTDQMIDYSASLIKRTIIMTHYADTDEPAISAVRDKINRCNNLYKLRYRDNVFDAEAILLGSQIFTDLNITRTQADVNAQAIGNLPPSLAADRVHATNAVYQYIAQKLADFIRAKNYLGK